jgi:cell division protein FtsA
MDGLLELAEEVFHMPVRLGVPQSVTGLEGTINDPVYSAGVGLLIYAQQHRFRGSSEFGDSAGVWARMRKWFNGNF